MVRHSREITHYSAHFQVYFSLASPLKERHTPLSSQAVPQRRPYSSYSSSFIFVNSGHPHHSRRPGSSNSYDAFPKSGCTRMVSVFSNMLLLWTSGVGYHRAAVREADCFGGHCSVNQGRGAGPRGAGHHVSAWLPRAWCAFDYGH